jgi:hypothetical protein
MKKSLIIFLVLFVLVLQNICAINLDYSDQGRQIKLTENTLEINQLADYDFVQTLESYEITQENIDGFLYISFDYTGDFLDKAYYPHGRVKLLVLYLQPKLYPMRNEGYLMMFDQNNECVYEIFQGNHHIEPSSKSIFASSELTEGNIVYKAESLWDYRTLIPWVEGVDGNGIGEKIIIEYNGPAYYGISISNGFVDFNRPYLYQSNNRVKKIKVTFGDTGTYEEFDLEDTPNFQTFFFKVARNEKYFTIEIVDVYHSTQWDDTCINKILTLAQ